MKSSFSIKLVPTVPKLKMMSLDPDKDGAVIVIVENSGDPRLPVGLALRPLFLVPKSVKLIANERRNVFQIPDDCNCVSVETTFGRSKGRATSYFLCLKIVATTPREKVIWHFDCAEFSGNGQC